MWLCTTGPSSLTFVRKWLGIRILTVYVFSYFVLPWQRILRTELHCSLFYVVLREDKGQILLSKPGRVTRADQWDPLMNRIAVRGCSSVSSFSPVNHCIFLGLYSDLRRNQHNLTLWTKLHKEVKVSYPSSFLTGSWIFIPVHLEKVCFQTDRCGSLLLHRINC